MSDQQNDSGNEAKQSFFAKQLLLDTTKVAFQQLSGLLKNITLYPASHPYVLLLAEKMMATIESLLTGRKEVAFYFVDGELFFEIYSVPIDENMTVLMEQFADRDIGGIVFKPEITIEELIKLAVVMSSEPAVLKAEEGISEALSRENISHIELHRKVVLVDKKSESKKEKEGEKKANELFKDAIEAIKDIVQNAQLNKAINMRRMNMVILAMIDSINDNRDALMGLTGLKMNDKHALAHLVNTSILAMSLANYLSFEKKQVIALGIAAMLHDIGKVRVPLEIINKSDRLTDEEWEVVARHPIEGALIVADIPGITKMAFVTVFEHHQHGSARYPQRDEADQQHLLSQIISLADAYEVLTAIRVYYNARIPCDQIIRILAQKRGSDFNAVLVKAFINLIGIFPIGTLLKLSSGEVGLVVHQTSDLMRPRVLLLTKFNGSEKESGEEISLLETMDGKFKRDVAGTIDSKTASIDLKLYLE